MPPFRIRDAYRQEKNGLIFSPNEDFDRHSRASLVWLEIFHSSTWAERGTADLGRFGTGSSQLSLAAEWFDQRNYVLSRQPPHLAFADGPHARIVLENSFDLGMDQMVGPRNFDDIFLFWEAATTVSR
jgi:hypothetical protein